MTVSICDKQESRLAGGRRLYKVTPRMHGLRPRSTPPELMPRSGSSIPSQSFYGRIWFPLLSPFSSHYSPAVSSESVLKPAVCGESLSEPPPSSPRAIVIFQYGNAGHITSRAVIRSWRRHAPHAGTSIYKRYPNFRIPATRLRRRPLIQAASSQQLLDDHPTSSSSLRTQAW